MRKVLFILVFATVLLAGVQVLRSTLDKRRALENLPVIHSVANIRLQGTDASWKTVEALKGKPTLVSFFFTHCPHICPTLTAKLAGLRQKLQHPELIHFASISVDPRRDTPAALKKFAETFGAAEDSDWLFLRPEEDSLTRILEKEFKVPSTEGQPAAHTTYMLVLDDQARIRAYFRPFDKDSWEQLERLVRTLGS